MLNGVKTDSQNELVPKEPGNRIKEIIYQIRRLIQANDLYTKELNRKYQVSAPQLNCLVALHENGSLPPSQIARLIVVKSSTVTGIIDRLEQKGLVARVRNSSDRRVITIELTEAGGKLAENAPPPLHHKIVAGLEKLSQDEIANVIESLNVLTGMLDIQNLEVG